MNFLEVIICSTSLLSVMCYLYYYSYYSFYLFLLCYDMLYVLLYAFIFFSFVRGEGWAYKTSLALPLYYFLSACTKLGKWAVMILCVRCALRVLKFHLFPQFSLAFIYRSAWSKTEKWVVMILCVRCVLRVLKVTPLSTVFSSVYLQKCLLQDRKVSGHDCVCYGYQFLPFQRFWYFILEFFWQCGILLFLFYYSLLNIRNVYDKANCN
jgi:hypothetical protein